MSTIAAANKFADYVSGLNGDAWYSRLFKKGFNNAKNASTAQKTLGYSGAGMLVFESIFGADRNWFMKAFDTILDVAGIACLFVNPALGATMAFGVAIGYGLKSLVHFGAAGFCLLDRDWTGLASNLLTAGLTIGCIVYTMPIRSVANKARTIVPVEKNAKLWEIYNPCDLKPQLKPGQTHVFGTQQMETIKHNVTRLEKEIATEKEHLLDPFIKRNNNLEEEICGEINTTREAAKKATGRKVTPESKITKGQESSFEKFDPSKHIDETSSVLQRSTAEAERKAIKAKEVLDAQKTEVEKVQKVITDKKAKNIKATEAENNQLKKLQEQESEISTKYSEADSEFQLAKSKEETFKQNCQELEDVKADISRCQERVTKLEGFKTQAQSAVTKAEALNTKYANGITEGGKSLAGQEAQGILKGDYLASLQTVQTNYSRALRLAIQEAYGVKEARFAKRTFDKTAEFARTTRDKGFCQASSGAAHGLMNSATRWWKGGPRPNPVHQVNPIVIDTNSTRMASGPITQILRNSVADVFVSNAGNSNTIIINASSVRYIPKK